MYRKGQMIPYKGMKFKVLAVTVVNGFAWYDVEGLSFKFVHGVKYASR